MTETLSASSDVQRRDALVDQIFHATIGAQELMHVYLGDRLGLYAALAKVDAASPAELADLAGIAERYALEWLEQQAVAGYLDVAEDTGEARTRRFRLPPGAADVLCDPASVHYLVPLAPMAISIAQTLPEVLEAFRTGGGVPFERYGRDIRDGIERANRPMFLNQLASEWIPALPDIEARLRRTDPTGHVADLGCGCGWSAIALARGYPAARVDGFDLDEASIDAARRNAVEEGVSDRVSFACRDAADPGAAGRYDLVTLLTRCTTWPIPSRRCGRRAGCSHPVAPSSSATRRSRSRSPPPETTSSGSNYGWSAPHCLAAALVEPAAVGTGTVIRPETVRRYALDAGFTTVTILPIEHDLWRFYRLGA